MAKSWIKMSADSLSKIRKQCATGLPVPAEVAQHLLIALDELNAHFNSLHEEALLIDKNTAESQREYERRIKKLEKATCNLVKTYLLVYVADRTIESIQQFYTLDDAQKAMSEAYEEKKAELFAEIEIPADDIRFEIHAHSAWINGGTLGYETEYHNDWVIRELNPPQSNPNAKESFWNAGVECFVMERSRHVPTTALIFCPANSLTPYIVAMGHKHGDTEWDSGKYFGNLSDALNDFASWDEGIEAPDGQ